MRPGWGPVDSATFGTRHKGHDLSLDWWGVGALLYEMIEGLPPFLGNTEMEVYEKVPALDYPLTVVLTLTHSLTHLLTHPPTHSPTHSLTHSKCWTLDSPLLPACNLNSSRCSRSTTTSLIYLLTDLPAYLLTHLRTYSCKVLALDYGFSEFFSQNASDLISQLLCLDSDQR